MAFNAGAIEATLTLNRNPFTAGLAAARSQARSFANERYEATARIKVDTTSFNAATKQLRDFARQSRQALAKVLVDRLQFDALLRDLREFGRSTYTARARVDTADGVRDLRDLTDALNRAGGASDANAARIRRFGDEGTRAFSRMHGAARLVMMTLPLLLPAAGSAITGIVGLLGGLISILGVAGVGAAAFGAVAVPVFKQIKSAVTAGQAEIDKLPPGLREAGNAMKGLTDHYQQLVKATQTPVGFAMAAGFNAAHAALGPLQPLIVNTANTLTEIGKRMTEYFNSAHYTGFVNFVAGNINPVLTRLFEIIAYGTRGVMNLTQAFMPLGQWLLDRIAAGMERFANWTATLAGNSDFQQWLELVKESLSAVARFIGEVIQFLFNLSNALAPVGNAILNVLSDIFDALSRMPPEWLGGIAMGLGAIMAALLLGAGGPMALVAGTIVGIASALKILYDGNENVRTSIDNLMDRIQTTFLPTWNTVRSNIETFVIPAFNRLVDAFNLHVMPVIRNLGDLIEQRLLPVFHNVMDTLSGSLVPAFLDFLTAIQPFVAFFTEHLGRIIVQGIELAGTLLDGALKILTGIFNTFTGIFTGDWDKFWNQGLKQVLESAGANWNAVFGTAMDGFTSTTRLKGDDLKTEWQNLFIELGILHETEHGNIKGDWENLFTELGIIVDRETGEINVTWLESLNQFEADLTAMDAKLNQIWLDMWNELKRIFTDWWGRITTEWNTFWAEVQRVNAEKSAEMDTAWSNFWTGLGQTFADWGTRLKTEWNAFWEEVKRVNAEKSAQLNEGWNNFWAELGRVFSDWWARITTEWNTFWDNVGRRASEAWNTLVEGARQASERIGQAWRAVANFFRDPINWVINVVLNDGVLRAWNTVMGWIGQPGLSVSPIANIPAFAQGGPVKGGEPNKDSVRAWLMPGEYVLSKRAIQNLGGLSAVDKLHEQARAGAASPYGPGLAAGRTAQALMRAVPMDDRGYAYGGVQPHVARAGDIINNALGPYPGGIGGKAPRANASDHPAGLALDFMSMGNMALGDRTANFIAANWGDLAIKYQIWRQRIASSPGAWRQMENRGSPTANHMDHVHASFLGEGGAGGLLQMIQVSMWELFGAAATNLMNSLLNFSGMPALGSPIGDAITNIPKAMIGKAIEALKAKMENLFTTQVAGTASPDAASMDVQNQVNAVAQRYGWGIGSDQWTPLSLLIGRESSWDPNAANPNSSARGLFQKMTSLHGPVESTVGGQTEWGLNYIKSKYGNPRAAWEFHKASGWYDQGGLLPPGLTPAMNGTRSPEAVLTGPQWDAVMRDHASNADVVRKLDELIEVMGTSGGGSPTINNYNRSGDETEIARRTLLSLRLGRR